MTRFKTTPDGPIHTMLEMDDMTWAEIDAVERKTGFTFAEVQAKFDECVVCHHSLSNDHTRPAEVDNVNVRVVTPCGKCECIDPTPAVPSILGAAIAWVSIKRDQPTLTWEEFYNSPAGNLVEVEDEELDPTEPVPAPAIQETAGGSASTSTSGSQSTKGSSRKSSASGRGSGTSSRRSKRSG